MAPVIVTLVRHGESVDNLTSLWAGYRDAPLTNHGFTQAMRLGEHFRDVPITAIYASDLKRARTTAKCVWDRNSTEPKPPFTVSPLLREQFFGEAEGMPWDAGKYHSAHLPWEDHRAFRLAPNAESLNDVAERATQVLRHFIMPHVLATDSVDSRSGEFPDRHHIVLFAHGIWLSEMLFAIKRAADPKVRFVKAPGGYQNTAWSRVELELDHDHDYNPRPSPSPPTVLEGGDGGIERMRSDDDDDQDEEDEYDEQDEAETSTSKTKTTRKGLGLGGRPPRPRQPRRPPPPPSLAPEFAALLPTLPNVPLRHPSLPPPFVSPDNHGDDEQAEGGGKTPGTGALPQPLPRIKYRVVAFNQGQHLVGLKRTKAGGVGSEGWDDKQRGIKDFFVAPPPPPPPQASTRETTTTTTTSPNKR